MYYSQLHENVQDESNHHDEKFHTENNALLDDRSLTQHSAISLLNLRKNEINYAETTFPKSGSYVNEASCSANTLQVAAMQSQPPSETCEEFELTRMLQAPNNSRNFSFDESSLLHLHTRASYPHYCRELHGTPNHISHHLLLKEVEELKLRVEINNLIMTGTVLPNLNVTKYIPFSNQFTAPSSNFQSNDSFSKVRTRDQWIHEYSRHQYLIQSHDSTIFVMHNIKRLRSKERSKQSSPK